jgi:predicted PurR-regulated permease PerM
MASDSRPAAPPAILAGLRPEHLYKAIGLVFLLALLYRYFTEITGTLLLLYAAAIMAVALNPIARKLPLGRTWVAALIGIAVLSTVGVLIYIGAPLLLAQIRDIAARAPEFEARFIQWSDYIRRSTGLNISLTQGGDQALRDFFGGVDGGAMLGRARGLLEVLFVPLIILFGGLFALANPNDRLLTPVLRSVPRSFRSDTRRIFELLGIRLLGWLKGVGIAMIGVGVLSYVAYRIIGVPNAFLLALLTGIFEFIPLVGPWIGGGAATLVAFTDDPTKGLYTAITALVIQQIEANVITPWAMSQQAEVHPLVTLFSLILFGSLFGFLGVLLALPLVILFWTVIEVLWVERAIDTDDDRIRPVVKE